MEGNKKTEPKSLVEDYYDTFSEVYLKEYGNIFQTALFHGDHCAVTAGRVPLCRGDGYPILDVGCGVGGVMNGLYRLGFEELTGITNSGKQVELAKEINPSLNIIHSDFMQWETDQEFNSVLLNESFGYFSEPTKLIQQVNSVLEFRGLVYLKDICAVSDPDMLQQASLAELEVLWNYKYYSTEEIVRLWDRAGYMQLNGSNNLWRISDCSNFIRFINGNSELSKAHSPSIGQVPIKAADFTFGRRSEWQ